MALANPLSSDLSLLRTTLLGSLLDAAHHNVARGIADLALFELGTVFRDDPGTLTAGDGPPQSRSAYGDTPVHEHRSLAVLISGRTAPPTWRAPEPPQADFYAAKGVLEALASALRAAIELRPAAEPFLHPGRSAAVRAGGRADRLDRRAASARRPQSWDVPAPAAFELDLDRLIAAARARAALRGPDQLPRPAPGPRRRAGSPRCPPPTCSRSCARAPASCSTSVRVFDVYEGPQVGEGRRSLALALSFRAADRTLTDEDVRPLRERIVAALARAAGG